MAETNRDFIQKMNQLGREKKPFAFLIDFECKKPLLWHLEDRQEEFIFCFNGKNNYDASFAGQNAAPKHEGSFVKDNVSSEGAGVKINLQKFPAGIEAYQKKFDKTLEHIKRGDSYLVNLTMSTPISLNAGFDVLFDRISSKYKCWLKNQFICFSPESFIRIKDGQVYAYPMKGTIDASLPNAQNTILGNQKEAAEHATIVDLIRNDLSAVATGVHVSRYRYYEVIRTADKDLGQVSSEISGTLPNDFSEKIGDIIFTLLPAGSVSGAPKKKTMTIIRDVEQENRGYYTGVAGYFDGYELDSCVLIRYIENNNIYRSGGGITSNSDVKSEYQELIDKVYVPIH